MKSGFVAVLGKPNVGKSSLVNALVGEKVSIVSPKAQTTRDRSMGILTEDDCQIVFVDTPGIHKAETVLGEYMEKCVKTATEDVDVVLIVLDGSRRVSDEEIKLIERHASKSAPVYVVVNKTDLISYEKLYPILDKLTYLLKEDGGRKAVKEIIPTSSYKKVNVDTLKKYIKSELKEGEFFFSPDDYTDKSERFMVSEIIREKTLLYLQDEIPHGVGVAVEGFNFDGKQWNIDADIVCEKSTHKPIIIGANGSMLRIIGEKSRLDIEKLLNGKVYLKLFVKVREDWRNRKNYMTDLGYNVKK